MDDDYIIFLLNTLGQAYLTTGNFDHTKEILIDTNNKFYQNMIKEFDNDYTVVDDYILRFSENLLLKKAETTVKYNKVVIEYPKFKNLVANSSKNYNWYNDRYCYQNEKSYFTINNPYSKITILSREKKSKITISDILLCGCELAIMYSESTPVVDIEYGGYQKLPTNNNLVLHLSPGFDNFK